MDGPLTLFEKIWTKHRILENNRGEALLLVDRHFLTDAAFISFEILKQHGRRIRKPDQTILVTDHTAATRNRAADIIDPEHRTALDLLRAHVLENGITWIDLKDPRQGIIHVVAPELELPAGRGASSGGAGRGRRVRRQLASGCHSQPGAGICDRGRSRRNPPEVSRRQRATYR